MTQNYKPAYPAEFRQQMVELVAAAPSNYPRNLAATTRRYKPGAGIPIRSNQAIALAATSSVSSLSANERQELLELRKKLKRVEMERDILAKATAWFANNKD